MLAITRILDGRYLDHATVLRRRRRAKEFGGVELQRKLRMRAS